MKIEDYITIIEKDSRDLNRKVREKIKDGYIPQGGISVSKTVNSQNSDSSIYAQALIKYSVIEI